MVVLFIAGEEGRGWAVRFCLALLCGSWLLPQFGVKIPPLVRTAIPLVVSVLYSASASAHVRRWCAAAFLWCNCRVPAWAGVERRGGDAAPDAQARQDRVREAVRLCPVETWRASSTLRACSVQELKRILLQRKVDFSACITKTDLVDLVVSGTSSTHRCAICLEDYVDQDTCRVLPHCGHVFHLVCCDEWLSQRREPACPMCNCPLLAPRT